MNAAPHESRSKVSPMQFPQGHEQRRVSSPPQAEFGRGPLISAKDAECCAGATEFQEAQKKGARPRRIGFAFHNSLPGNSKRIPELTLVIAAWNGESDKLLSPDAVRRIAGISPLRTALYQNTQH